MRRGKAGDVLLTPQEAFKARLVREDGRRCYLAPKRVEGRYGPCSGPLHGHHLIPQRILKRIDLGVPVSFVLSDYRNGVLVCERHHDFLDMQRIRPRILDLPRRFVEFLNTWPRLWAEAERLYVRPPGHSLPRGRLADTSRDGSPS